MENTKPKEKDLPCLFENLVEKYQGSRLAKLKKDNDGVEYQGRKQLKE